MRYLRSIITCITLGTTSSLFAQFCCGTASYMSPRSQGTNAAHDCITLHELVSREVPTTPYGMIDIQPAYQRAFNTASIANYFFGDNVFEVSGSLANDKPESAILADYFGLSQKYDSDVTACPFMRNILCDISGWFCYHRWYIHVDAPFCWTKTSMNLCERVRANTTDPYPANYMDTDPITPPYANFIEAISSGQDFGQVHARSYGNAANCLCHAGLADFHGVIGYKLVDRFRGHASLGLCLGIPTGNQPCPEYLFPPIVGNGHHWQLGVVFTGDGLLWERNGNQRVEVVVYVTLEHLFKNRQMRSFDLKRNCYGSRYILAKEFDEHSIYADSMFPAINVTTRCCDVSVSFQCDAAILAGYRYKGLRVALGYDAWVRSHEKIACIDPLPENTYALKGIQNIGRPTQSKATIYGNPFADQALVADSPSPIFFNTGDLNPESAATPLAFTNKVFFNLQYAWRDNPQDPKHMHPYLGTGFSVEFVGANEPQYQFYKPTISQWSVWAQTGLMF